MDASAPLDTTLGQLGLIAAALLAAAAVLVERPRLRAAAMAGALVLTPILLIAEIYDTEQFRTLRDRPAFTAAAVAAALVAVGVLAFAMNRRPLLLPLLAVGALPFRIPVEAAGQTANLLVPLYGVIAAGALAQMPALFADRRAAGHPRAAARARSRCSCSPSSCCTRCRPCMPTTSASPRSRSSSSTCRSRFCSACSCGSSGPSAC